MNRTPGPGWASGLGAVVVLLGVLLAAWHGNEWMKLAIVGAPPWSLEQMPEADCEPDELAEEGLTLEECHQLAVSVHDINISAPGWFPAFHIAVSAAGLLLALLSVFAGIALVDYRRWAPTAALTVLAALAVLDLVSFVGVVKVGPLIRQMYLWSILLWFFIHLSMAVAALAGYRNEREAPEPYSGQTAE